jgi:predicted ATPase
MLDRIVTALEYDERAIHIGAAAALFEWLGDGRIRSLESLRLSDRRSQGVDALWSADAVDGWLLVRRGHVADGLQILKDSARGLRDMGAFSALPQSLAWLAESFLLDGQIDQARAAAEDGLAMIRTTGVRCCDPELYRLRGEAMLATRRSCSNRQLADRDRDAAEASFWAGITVARQQEARTLELRATVSLARLLFTSGREDEAKRNLAPICESFADDQTSPDLEKARRLLSAN